MHERAFQFAGIPLLAVAQDGGRRPAVLFYHGLHSDKETHRKELESLAQRGFLALGVDTVGHGQRRMPDLAGYLERGPLRSQVEKLIRPSLEEVPLLLDFLEAQGYGPFALMGVSMGAMLAYAAPQRDSRLRAVVAVLGDPDWCQPYDRPQAYRSVAMLAWNAGQDSQVPPGPARGWLEYLRDQFPEGDFAYQEYAESDHFMRPEDWEQGWKHSLDWLSRFLS